MKDRTSEEATEVTGFKGVHLKAVSQSSVFSGDAIDIHNYYNVVSKRFRMKKREVIKDFSI